LKCSSGDTEDFDNLIEVITDIAGGGITAIGAVELGMARAAGIFAGLDVLVAPAAMADDVRTGGRCFRGMLIIARAPFAAESSGIRLPATRKS
jgi:hypothetical protein